MICATTISLSMLRPLLSREDPQVRIPQRKPEDDLLVITLTIHTKGGTCLSWAHVREDGTHISYDTEAGMKSLRERAAEKERGCSVNAMESDLVDESNQ